MFGKKLITYLLAGTGGVLLGVGLVLLIDGLIGGSFFIGALVVAVIGAALAGASVPVSGRPRKAVGLTLGGVGGATFAVAVVFVLFRVALFVERRRQARAVRTDSP